MLVMVGHIHAPVWEALAQPEAGAGRTQVLMAERWVLDRSYLAYVERENRNISIYVSRISNS